MCALFNARYANWSMSEATLNSSIAFGLLVFLIIYPVAIQLFLYMRKASLGKKAFIAKYGVAYEGLEIKGNGYLYQPLLSYFRRLLLPLSIIFYPEVFILHYFTLTMTGVFTIILVGVQRPFESKARNFAEVVEESAIILVMYHVFCFTDWLPDEEVRHKLGYSVIACILLHLFVFLAIKLFWAMRSCYKERRRQYLLKKAREHAQRQMLKVKP